jgi:hypothetical protein
VILIHSFSRFFRNQFQFELYARKLARARQHRPHGAIAVYLSPTTREGRRWGSFAVRDLTAPT